MKREDRTEKVFAILAAIFARVCACLEQGPGEVIDQGIWTLARPERAIIMHDFRVWFICGDCVCRCLWTPGGECDVSFQRTVMATIETFGRYAKIQQRTLPFNCNILAHLVYGPVELFLFCRGPYTIVIIAADVVD